jgi:peroxiredoxin (alkyl hydroperoxide reductase subunit C)
MSDRPDTVLVDSTSLGLLKERTLMVLKPGDAAPDFELKDTERNLVRLSDFKGKQHVLLIFYPLAFSGICTGELCSLRDSLDHFRSDEVETIGISVDSNVSLKAWAEKEGFEFPLLADFWPHGGVAQQYGVFDDATGLALRGTFLVDKTGTIVFSEVNAIPEARDQQRWRDALAELGVAS